MARQRDPGPSLMPFSDSITRLFVGNGAQAMDVKTLKRLNIGAVLNCAPNVCKDPVKKDHMKFISYATVDAHDDSTFSILSTCLDDATSFVDAAHARGKGVLVHCMAGSNRSATLGMAYILSRDKPNLFDLFEEASMVRPSILQNQSFQLQLCQLAKGLNCLTRRESDNVRNKKKVK
ncbi:hypothetical protein TrLO_g5379 [Triparma laevis f. longispina]|uniref:protein-tyrosine-phosphatase n=1 Tax=Triparma laevis f. longispina TaxID=1714387 RepID=A0A9W6ZPR5_9STRA|nr:hypothetical protein TrLO_g5379 [Triparma laevis f. longispina]